MLRLLFTTLLSLVLWCGRAQNQPPLFLYPNYTDTTLEADRDTCLLISIIAPEAGDSVILWAESVLFQDEDSVVYLTQKAGLGSLDSYLCFHKVCRKVQDEPYLFTLYARDSSYDTSIYHFRVRLENSLARELTMLPNVFSPNDDGFNDEFSLKGSKAQCANLFNVYIYNRWGGLVFSSNRISFSWDGDNCSEGVYYYVISSGGGISAKGTLTLIR